MYIYVGDDILIFFFFSKGQRLKRKEPKFYQNDPQVPPHCVKVSSLVKIMQYFNCISFHSFDNVILRV